MCVRVYVRYTVCVRIESANVHGSRQVSLQTRRKPENMHTQLEATELRSINAPEHTQSPKLELDILS